MNKDLRKTVETSIPVEMFHEIKKNHEYEEGNFITSIFTHGTMPISMYVDIKEENFDKRQGLESWCYVLKEDGDPLNEEDYIHYDGGMIVSKKKMNKCSYEEFISAVVKNIKYFARKYELHFKEKEKATI